MNDTKLRGMLGLAVRARQVSFGEEACRLLVRSGKCGVMLLDGEAGSNTRKKAEALCGAEGVALAVLPPGLIAQATGRGNMTAAVTEGAFAEQIRRIMNPV